MILSKLLSADDIKDPSKHGFMFGSKNEELKKSKLIHGNSDGNLLQAGDDSKTKEQNSNMFNRQLYASQRIIKQCVELLIPSTLD